MGHRYADPEETLASFAAARQQGADMIEVDVLSEHPGGAGRILVAHDYSQMRARVSLPFEDAVTHLAGQEYATIRLNIDVKRPGYELEVVRLLRELDLVPRSMVSSTFPETLREIRLAEPRIALGLSVPPVRRDYSTDMLTAIPYAAYFAVYRALLPRRAHDRLLGGHTDALMAHWRLVTPALVRAVAKSHGELFAFTVNDEKTIRRLTSLGVTGIITDNLSLFKE
jgi:glycerophosphoryl diester phosphodiesterase